MLLIQNYDLGDMTVWDAKTKRLLPININGYSPIFSPNGNLLVVNNEEGTIVVWDLTIQKKVSETLVGDAAVFSKNSKFILVQNNSNYTFTLWSVSQNKKLIEQLSGYNPAFSPNGEMLAYLEYDKDGETIKVWDGTKQDVIWSGAGSTYTFSPDSTLLAINDYYTITTKILDLRTRTIIEEDLPGNTSIFSSDSNNMLIQDYYNYTFSVWNRKTRNFVIEASQGETPLFSPDGSVLTYNKGDEIKLVNLKNQEEIPNQLRGYYPQFIPNHNMIVIQDSYEFITTVWDISEEQNSIEPFNIIPALPNSLVFSSNNQKLASIAESNIIIWDVENPASYQRLSVEESPNKFISGVFYSEATKFASLTENGNLVIWDLSNDLPASIIKDNWVPNSALIQKFAFSPDGNYLVYDASENKLGAWDLIQNEILSQSGAFSEIESVVGSIAFSPDGSYLGYSDAGKIFLYTFPDLQKIGELSTGFDVVSDMEIILKDAEPKYIVSQDGFGHTQLWDWESRTKAGISMPGYFTLLGSNAFDESFMYIDAADKLVKFNWQLDIDAWKNILCPFAKRNFRLEEWNTYFPNTDYPDKSVFLTCPMYPSGRTE